jgi:putative ABC transport system substrate-binding protein
VRAAEAAAPTQQLAVSSAGIQNASDVEHAIATFAKEPNGGLIVLPNPVSGTHRALIIALANRHRLPAIGAFRYMSADGRLISYGVDVPDMYRRVAEYVDRILKGDKPADLPVQVPTKYELVINLKTAKAIGVTVPPTLVVRADEVIEQSFLLRHMSRILARTCRVSRGVG